MKVPRYFAERSVLPFFQHFFTQVEVLQFCSTEWKKFFDALIVHSYRHFSDFIYEFIFI